MPKRRIALFAPIHEIVPPPTFGGTELIVWLIAEELSRRGHDVTVFARAESRVSGKLVSLGIDASHLASFDDNIASRYRLAAELVRRADRGDFDIIHNHENWRFLPFSRLITTPFVSTIHNVLYEKFHDLYRLAQHTPFVSISDSQRQHAPKELPFIATVYHGIDVQAFPFTPEPPAERYLLWVGRIVTNKGVAEAIEIARRAGLPLKLAGKVYDWDPKEKRYFEEQVRPAIERGEVEYLGEVGGQQKYELFANAFAFINPILWDEPFGLVVAESNAGGTPVVTFARGSMAELIDDGVNGFLIAPGNLDGMVEAVEQLKALSPEDYQAFRSRCRQRAEERFTIARMVDDYEAVYEQVIEASDHRQKGQVGDEPGLEG